jgi:hypothetical protein
MKNHGCSSLWRAVATSCAIALLVAGIYALFTPGGDGAISKKEYVLPLFLRSSSSHSSSTKQDTSAQKVEESVACDKLMVGVFQKSCLLLDNEHQGNLDGYFVGIPDQDGIFLHSFTYAMDNAVFHGEPYLEYVTAASSLRSSSPHSVPTGTDDCIATVEAAQVKIGDDSDRSGTRMIIYHMADDKGELVVSSIVNKASCTYRKLHGSDCEDVIKTVANMYKQHSGLDLDVDIPNGNEHLCK